MWRELIGHRLDVPLVRAVVKNNVGLGLGLSHWAQAQTGGDDRWLTTAASPTHHLYWRLGTPKVLQYHAFSNTEAVAMP
ncbi:hypothetical protein ACLOJK_003211 [Asimina triloba]